jgi:hypothetical protein
MHVPYLNAGLKKFMRKAATTLAGRRTWLFHSTGQYLMAGRAYVGRSVIDRNVDNLFFVKQLVSLECAASWIEFVAIRYNGHVTRQQKIFLQSRSSHYDFSCKFLAASKCYIATPGRVVSRETSPARVEVPSHVDWNFGEMIFRSSSQ